MICKVFVNGVFDRSDTTGSDFLHVITVPCHALVVRLCRLLDVMQMLVHEVQISQHAEGSAVPRESCSWRYSHRSQPKSVCVSSLIFRLFNLSHS